jgi:hypothetical protein
MTWLSYQTQNKRRVSNQIVIVPKRKLKKSLKELFGDRFKNSLQAWKSGVTVFNK